VVYVDKISRTDKAKRVEDTAKVVSQLEVPEQPKGLAGSGIWIGYHGAGITARTLKGAKTKGFHSKLKL
jgi:hypothetical protein